MPRTTPSETVNRYDASLRILATLDAALGAPVLASTLLKLEADDWNRAALLADHHSGKPSFATRELVIAIAEKREEMRRVA